MKGRKREKKEGAGIRMPDAFVLREGAYIAQGAVQAGGAVLLAYRIALPAFWEPRAAEKGGRAQARVASFYARVAWELWRTCEGALFPSVRRAYDACEDSYKKYRFARYTLTVDFTEARAAGEIHLSRRALLSRRGRVLCERVWEERFCEKSGRVQLRRLSRLLSRIRPKQGLRETLKSVIPRHTGSL